MSSRLSNKGFFSFYISSVKKIKWLNSKFVFLVSRQKACINTKAGLDFEECKSSVKRDATIVSCNPGTAPKPAILFSLLLQQILILASGVLFIRLRRALTLTVSLFTLARHQAGFDVSPIMRFTNDN